MKRLNKITLILVAVMGMAISGCGSDMKKAPFVKAELNNGIILSLAFCANEEIKKSEEKFSKCLTAKPKYELISLKGKRDCSKLPVKYGATFQEIIIESVKDCPPKDRLSWRSYRLSWRSYEFTIKTSYGTFKYDTSDKSTEAKYGYYAPIGYKGGKK